MTYSFKFYPNGEFTHGVTTTRTPKKPHDDILTIPHPQDPNQSQRQQEYMKLVDAYGIVCFDQPGMRYTNRRGEVITILSNDNGVITYEAIRDYGVNQIVQTDYPIVDMVLAGDLIPLVHQTVESCDSAPSRKKLEGMTRNMARNLRQAVYLMEQDPGGKDVLSFLTLTLPGLPPEGLAACCKNWDGMVKKFMDWLRVTLQRKGIPFEYAYCTEIQPGRLQQRQEYAPHLHIVFKGRQAKGKAWAVTPQQVRRAWARCIREVYDGEFDTRALENLQRVKYSASRYLSKYLSKGSCTIPDTDDGDAIQGLRTQWGGMARSLSRRVRQATTVLKSDGMCGDLCRQIFDHIPDCIKHGYIKWYKEVFIPIGRCETTGLEYGLHGGSGCLQTPTYEGGLASLIGYLQSLE
jgi:hypothetical protein